MSATFWQKTISSFSFKLKQEKTTSLFNLLQFFLIPLSYLYKTAIVVRHFAYKQGLLPKSYFSIPIISVGSIVAGGSGKTPTTLMLARQLQKDFKVGILIRGYRSKAEKSKIPFIIGPRATYEERLIAGDEASYLAARLNQAVVIVGKNRIKGAILAIKMGVECLILEDGFQHLKIVRDQDIVVLDAKKPFGNGHFLPAGFLRDTKESLKKASLLVFTNYDGSKEAEKNSKEVSFYTDAPQIYTQLVVEGIYNWAEEKLPFDIKDKKVGVFSSIANPSSFKNTILSLGAQVVKEYVAPDHVAIASDQLEKFAHDCKALNADLLITTEKDWIKMPSSLQENLPLAWVKTSLRIVQGQEYWEKINDSLKMVSY